MPHSYIERQRIHRRAKAKLGLLKRDAQDREEFISQCIDNITSEGDISDEDDARSICELLYDEGDDLGEYD